MVQPITTYVENLAGHRRGGCLQRDGERSRGVAAVDVGAPLVAAENGNAPVDDGVCGERVHDEVEPHAGGQSEYRREPQRDRLDLPAAIEHDVLAEDPGPRVEGDRVEPRALGQQRLPAGAVHAAARGEHEAAHAVQVAGVDQDLRGRVIQVDRLFRIEIAGRVADDRGEGGHGFDAAHRLAQIPAVADVAAHDFEARVVESGNARPPVVEAIEDTDVVASVEQHAGQVGPDVPGTPGDEDAPRAVVVLGIRALEPRTIQQLV